MYKADQNGIRLELIMEEMDGMIDSRDAIICTDK